MQLGRLALFSGIAALSLFKVSAQSKLADPANCKGFPIHCPIYGGNCRITSPFSLSRLDPVTLKVQPHKGIDLAADKNTAVLAPLDGEVLRAESTGTLGNVIVIRTIYAGEGAFPPTSAQFLFAHLDSFLVKKGDMVRAQQVVGLADNTGQSKGPHLHFEYTITDFHPKDLLDIKSGRIDPAPCIDAFY